MDGVLLAACYTKGYVVIQARYRAMFFRYLFSLVFFLLTTVQLHAHDDVATQWLPVIGTGGGFNAAINLVNIDEHEVEVSITSFSTSGEPLAILADGGQAVAGLGLMVPGGGNTVVQTVPGSQSLQVGWVRIDGDIRVNTTLEIGDTGGGAVPNRMQFPTTEPARKLVFTASSGNGRDTSMAIMAPPINAGTASINLTAVDQSGEPAGVADIQMPAGRMGFLVLADLMPELGEFDGSVQLTSSFSVVVQPFREDGELISSLRLFPPRPDPVNSNGCGDFSDWETSDYVLPFPPGTGYQVNQGNCSGFGHNGIFLFGYDFIMDIGTPVSAARGGIVIFTNENVPDGNRAGTNLITIQHEDGTTALYSHLTINGVFVEPGQRVEAGNIIGLSGDTGNTGGLPHLHFSLHSCASLPGLPGSDSCPSIPVTFRNTQPNPFGLNPQVSYSAEVF